VPLVAVLVLIVMAVYLGQLSRTAADPDQLKLLAGLCAGGAIGLLLLTVLRRK
jgi:hypothetical protein